MSTKDISYNVQRKEAQEPYRVLRAHDFVMRWQEMPLSSAKDIEHIDGSVAGKQSSPASTIEFQANGDIVAIIRADSANRVEVPKELGNILVQGACVKDHTVLCQPVNIDWNGNVRSQIGGWELGAKCFARTSQYIDLFNYLETKSKQTDIRCEIKTHDGPPSDGFPPGLPITISAAIASNSLFAEEILTILVEDLKLMVRHNDIKVSCKAG